MSSYNQLFNPNPVSTDLYKMNLIAVFVSSNSIDLIQLLASAEVIVFI